MRLRPRRSERPPVGVAPGEKVLAWTRDASGAVLAGTREACYLEQVGLEQEGGATRIPWEQVEAADWDQDTGLFRLSEVGEWGEQRPVHELTIEEPGRFLELARERVTATIVLVHHVTVRGRRGVRVVARRAPAGGELHWIYEFDPGVDEHDPEVRRLAAEGLAAAREQVGEA